MKKKPTKMKAVKAWAAVLQGNIIPSSISPFRGNVGFYYGADVPIPVIIRPLPRRKARKAKK